MIRKTLLTAAGFSLALAMPAYAQTGTADMDQVREKLSEADVSDSRDFGGKLLRARTENGATVFMLVSPRDLGADGEVEISDSDLRERFEGAGFTDIQVVDTADFALGNLDDDYSIIVMSAEDVRDPTATGTLAPRPGMGGATTPAVPGAPTPGAMPGATPGAPGTDAPAPRTAPQ